MTALRALTCPARAPAVVGATPSPAELPCQTITELGHPPAPSISRSDRVESPGGIAVIPGSFAYHRPKSVSEAVALLADLGEEARPLAGGHSLIPMMKLRLAAPEHLIDLAGLAELKGVRSEGGEIVIGAMTTQYDLVASDVLAAKLPILRETALVIA